MSSHSVFNVYCLMKKIYMRNGVFLENYKGQVERCAVVKKKIKTSLYLKIYTKLYIAS